MCNSVLGQTCGYTFPHVCPHFFFKFFIFFFTGPKWRGYTFPHVYPLCHFFLLNFFIGVGEEFRSATLPLIHLFWRWYIVFSRRSLCGIRQWQHEHIDNNRMCSLTIECVLLLYDRSLCGIRPLPTWLCLPLVRRRRRLWCPVLRSCHPRCVCVGGWSRSHRRTHGGGLHICIMYNVYIYFYVRSV